MSAVQSNVKPIEGYKYINIQLDIEIGEYNYCCYGENNVYLISHTFDQFVLLSKREQLCFCYRILSSA